MSTLAVTKLRDIPFNVQHHHPSTGQVATKRNNRRLCSVNHRAAILIICVSRLHTYVHTCMAVVCQMWQMRVCRVNYEQQSSAVAVFATEVATVVHVFPDDVGSYRKIFVLKEKVSLEETFAWKKNISSSVVDIGSDFLGIWYANLLNLCIKSGFPVNIWTKILFLYLVYRFNIHIYILFCIRKISPAFWPTVLGFLGSRCWKVKLTSRWPKHLRVAKLHKHRMHSYASCCMHAP